MKYINYETRPIKDIRDMLRSSVELYGPLTAFLEKHDGVYMPTTYDEFYHDVCRLGNALLNPEKAERRIIVIGENGYHWALAYMTVVCGLGVVIPLDRESTCEDITYIAGFSEADTVLYSRSAESKVAPLGNIRKICFDEFDELIASVDEPADPENDAYKNIEIDADKMSVLLFTSGTTGVAKGVMLSQHNIAFNLSEVCRMAVILPEDTFLSVLPLHHTYECTCGFLVPLYRGSTIAYCEKLSYITKNLAETKATVILAVPLLIETMYKKIMRSAEKSGKLKTMQRALKLSHTLKKAHIDITAKLFKEVHQSLGGHLRLIISGGASVDPTVLEGLRDLGIFATQGYGLTECAPIAAVNRDCFFNDRSAGLATPNAELAIDEPDEAGIGEVKYRGENIMLGYYKQPEMTAEVIRDGWFYTGDLGYLDKDGFLIITGRKKNVIVTNNGKNIYPEELEVHLGRDPHVIDVMITGEENAEGDTIVKAVIYPDYELVNSELNALGIKTDDISTPDYRNAVRSLFSGIINRINLGLVPFKRVRRFVIRRDEFEKTTTKKIKRFAEANHDDSDNL